MVQHTHCSSGAAECRDRAGEDFNDVEIVAGENWLEDEPADARQAVRHAPGAFSSQLDQSIPAAVAALVARAAAEHRSLDEVADDLVHGRLTIPIHDVPEEQEGGARDVEDWYAESSRRTELLGDSDPIDADRWLYVHRDELIGATSGAAVDLIRESGMVVLISRERETAPSSDVWDRGRIRLFVSGDDMVRSAQWG